MRLKDNYLLSKRDFMRCFSREASLILLIFAPCISFGHPAAVAEFEKKRLEYLFPYLPENTEYPVFKDLPKVIQWSTTANIVVVPRPRGKSTVEEETIQVNTAPTIDVAKISEGKTGFVDFRKLAGYAAKLQYLYDHPDLGLPQLPGQGPEHYACIKQALDEYRTCIVNNFDKKMDFPACIRSEIGIKFSMCCDIPSFSGASLNDVEKNSCNSQNYPWTKALNSSAKRIDSEFNKDYWFRVKYTLERRQKSRTLTPEESRILNIARNPKGQTPSSSTGTAN